MLSYILLDILSLKKVMYVSSVQCLEYARFIIPEQKCQGIIKRAVYLVTLLV